MNIYKEFNKDEIELMSKVIKIENKDYTKDETIKIQNSIVEDIIRRSSKNGDIEKASVEYENILDKLERRLNKF